MGREFARFSVKLNDTFDLSEGLDAESPGVTSANFYGPDGSHTDVTNSLESLNALASNNTKYTIIDIPEASGSKIIAHGIIGTSASEDILVNATVTKRWSATGTSAKFTDIQVPSSSGATVLATAANNLGSLGGKVNTVSVRSNGNDHRFTVTSDPRKIYFAVIKG